MRSAKQVYEWVKTGHWNRKQFLEWAQPEQEPVYVYTCKGCQSLFWENCVSCDCTVDGLIEFDRHVLSGSTSPQTAQRTWVGLTDDEKLHIEIMGGKSDVMLAEMVEAKLKEKNT